MPREGKDNDVERQRLTTLHRVIGGKRRGRDNARRESAGRKGDAVSKHGDFKRCQRSRVGANRGGNFRRGTEDITRVDISMRCSIERGRRRGRRRGCRARQKKRTVTHSKLYSEKETSGGRIIKIQRGGGEKGVTHHASASACKIVRRDVIYATINERRDFA